MSRFCRSTPIHPAVNESVCCEMGQGVPYQSSLAPCWFAGFNLVCVKKLTSQVFALFFGMLFSLRPNEVVWGAKCLVVGSPNRGNRCGHYDVFFRVPFEQHNSGSDADRIVQQNAVTTEGLDVKEFTMVIFTELPSQTSKSRKL